MFEARKHQNSKFVESEQSQKVKNKAQNIQAPSKQVLERPIINVEFGNEIIIRCLNLPKDGVDFFGWPWRNQKSMRNNQNLQILTNLIQSSPQQNCSSDAFSKSDSSPKKLLQSQNQANFQMEEERLYLECEAGLLKKQLEFQYKGLLSKSTDSDETLGMTVLFRFRCKNNITLNCPFLHTLEYCKVQDGKIYYKHRSICSSHTPQCTLDDQNIQYNVVMRKIDSSMEILEQIIKQEQSIKPKEILQIFAKKINESSQDFLYDGLETKSIRRSIKKYFDNAVAKVKGKLRHK